MGWEVRPSFSVSQNAERAEPPHLIQEMWGCGSIRPDRSDSTLKYEVRKVREIVKVAMRMNSSGRRKYSEDEILSSLRPGEGIVCARGTTAG